MKEKKATAVAKQEAYEEAGLLGDIIGKQPLGNYFYDKRLPQGTLRCEVRVFSLRVRQQLDDWPEKSERERRWFDANEAAEHVDEGGLSEIIRRFAGSSVRFVVYKKHHRSRALLPRQIVRRDP
jgi:8-oxo-dGTP pyrophosphatase MutT (NUDIX family)